MSFRGATDLPTDGVRQVADACRSPSRGRRWLLVPYDPFRTDSPYRSSSPVFVHVRPCAPHVGAVVPEQQRRRLLSVRSFDGDARTLDADVVEGRDLEPLLQTLLRRPDAAFVHLHDARPGCSAARVDRA